LKKKRNAVILSSSSDDSLDNLPVIPVSLNVFFIIQQLVCFTHASKKRHFKYDNELDSSRKAKFAKLDVIDTISPVLFSSPVTTPFQKPALAISDQDLRQVKDRIKSLVYCFEDIQTIHADDIVFIFKLREQAEKLGLWTNTTPDEPCQAHHLLCLGAIA
jgi:hypothetical protein